AVEEDHQRIGVARLVAGRQETANRETFRLFHLGGVESFRGSVHLPRNIRSRHAKTCCIEKTAFSEGRRFAGVCRGRASQNRAHDSSSAKSTTMPKMCQRRNLRSAKKSSDFWPLACTLQRLGDVDWTAAKG